MLIKTLVQMPATRWPPTDGDIGGDFGDFGGDL